MTEQKKHLFDNPKNSRRLIYALIACLLLLLALEPLIEMHPYFPWEEWPGFYAIFGFAACSLLVLAAGYIFRPLVKRAEDYYD
ncbi:MAG: hypothetical protein R6W72_12935 [Desulfurivibrionaceae bacterium]